MEPETNNFFFWTEVYNNISNTYRVSFKASIAGYTHKKKKNFGKNAHSMT